MNTITNKLAREIGRKKDKVIADAVAHKIRGWYTLDELRERVVLQIIPSEALERLYVDGELMVEFSPPKFEISENGTSQKFQMSATTTYHYKQFYKKERIDG